MDPSPSPPASPLDVRTADHVGRQQVVAWLSPTGAAASIMAAVAIGFIVLVLERCRHGIDFTDEGFYLNLISNPWIYKFTITQFGLLYHPIYRMLGGNVVVLRQLSVVVTFALAFAAAFAILRRGRPWRSQGCALDAVLAISVAMPGLLYLSYWLPSPGYNVLTLDGLLIATLGLLTAHDDKDDWARMAASAVLVGLGGWLVFLGKPSSALMLAVAAPIVMVSTARRPWRLMPMAGGTALILLLAVACVLDGSPAGFVDRYRIGIEASATLSPAYSLANMFRGGPLDNTEVERAVFWSILVLAAAALALSIRYERIGSALALIVTIGLAIACVALMISPDLLDRLPPPRLATTVLVAAAPLGVVVVVFLVAWRRLISRAGLQTLILTAFLVACPFIFAFGTNTVLTHQAMLAAVFWGLAGSLQARDLGSPRLASRATLLIAVAAVPITIGLIGYSMENPYRQRTALRHQNEPVAIGPGGATRLLVDLDTARYLRELRAALGGPAHKDGMPLLDMTGAHPGALFAVGAKAVGMPWLPGGYPGSEAFANRALSFVPCDELARAWVLTSPSGTRPLPDSVLERAGLKNNLVVVANIRGRNGDPTQTLYKPGPDVANTIARCSGRS